MKKNLKNLFTEDVQNILSEESLAAIETAFDEKVKMSVETALLEQDEVYAKKLETLINAIDQDHSKKMKRVVESVDKSKAAKLAKIIKLYERDSKLSARKFKKTLVESISSYLDEYLREAIPSADISQAVKNRTAFNILENMRKVLAVDSSLIDDSFQEAIVDGNKQIVKLQKENAELKTQFKALYEHNQKMEVTSLLESKTAKYPEAKKSFLRKALADKTVKFIEENFDYTARLFDKQEKSKLQTLKEDALNKRTLNADVIPEQKVDKSEKVVTESVNNNSLKNDYLQVLSRGKGQK